MDPITVRHSRGAYEISFATPEHVNALDVQAIITDENVSAAIGEWFPDLPTLVLPPGERTKSLASLGECLSFLASDGIGRRHRLAAIGGGVIGDLAGFAAATYMRGIDYVQVPTSLLAMVDSSVGGKVGIDLPEGKNLAGAFHPPAEVVIVEEALKTLPARHVTNGMAEVIKYTLINSRKNPSIRECIEIKRDIVEADEFETKGLRATLNFGHTIGHAIEAASDFELLHGEAIAIGMVGECALGEALGITEPGTTSTAERLILAQNLPCRIVGLTVEPILEFIRRDKKAGFALLSRVGECKLCTGIPESAIRNVLLAYGARA